MQDRSIKRVSKYVYTVWGDTVHRVRGGWILPHNPKTVYPSLRDISQTFLSWVD